MIRVVIVTYLFFLLSRLVKFLEKKTNLFFTPVSADEVCQSENIRGKVIVITGASTGIGKETARVLAKNGAKTIVITGRDIIKLEKSRCDLVKGSTCRIVALPLDLSDPESIFSFVQQLKSLKIGTIDILINNAGCMAIPSQTRSKEGHEFQIACNHFGTFRLTLLLLPLMKYRTFENDKVNSRIIVVSSIHHMDYADRIYFEDLNSERREYSSFEVYGHSKLANVMFAKYLDQLLKRDGLPIEVFSLHPGVIKTEIQRELIHPILSWIYYNFPGIDYILQLIVFKSLNQGAACSVYVASAKEINGKGGSYFSDCKIVEELPYARDIEEQRRLWEVTEKITNVSYEKVRLKLCINK